MDLKKIDVEGATVVPQWVLKLKEARDLIARDNGWCKGYLFTDAWGMPIAEWNINEPMPAKVCAVGAICISDKQIPYDDHPALFGLFNALPSSYQMKADLLTNSLCWKAIATFNNASETTQADVVALFDRALTNALP